MGINLTNGEVTIAGKVVNTADRIVEATENEVIKATQWLPHARARIREATIIKLKTEHPEMSWALIGKHPDVRLTPAGVIAAYYRTINRWIEPEQVQDHIRKSLRTIDMVNDLAFGLYDKRKPVASKGALDTVIKAEERKSKLLGLDAPKDIRLTDGKGVLEMLASAEAIPQEAIEAAQANDPYERPNDAVEKRDNIVPAHDREQEASDVVDEARRARNKYVPLEERSEEEIAALDQQAKEFLEKFERAQKKRQGSEIADKDRKIHFEVAR